mgnify:CR=1 FL=1
MKMTPGKRKGMQAVSNERGVIVWRQDDNRTGAAVEGVGDHRADDEDRVGLRQDDRRAEIFGQSVGYAAPYTFVFPTDQRLVYLHSLYAIALAWPANGKL